MNYNVSQGISNCEMCVNKRKIIPTGDKFDVDCTVKGMVKACYGRCKQFRLDRAKDAEPKEKKLDLLDWTGVN